MHLSPVWRQLADFVIHADIEAEGLPRRWEQLWVRRTSESEFQLCCIPFFTYNLSLGDVVSTHACNGKQYVVASVVRPSGRGVLRLWFGDCIQKERKDIVQADIAAASDVYEWYSDHFVA